MSSGRDVCRYLPDAEGGAETTIGKNRPAMKLLETFRSWLFRGPSRAEKQLLQRCYGDPAHAERLIRHELERRPQLSRVAASKSALERWARDR